MPASAAAWQCSILATLIAPAAAWDFTLIRVSSVCTAHDAYLGHHCTPADCAAACGSEPGCWFFSVGHGDAFDCRCWAKHTKTPQCAEGFVSEPSYDFYAVDGLSNKTAHPFVFFREGRSYSDAMSYCASVGGSLAFIRSSSENELATSLCSPYDCWSTATSPRTQCLPHALLRDV
jgi:hypothetical protein